jgi:hypothetical protein
MVQLPERNSRSPSARETCEQSFRNTYPFRLTVFHRCEYISALYHRASETIPSFMEEPMATPKSLSIHELSGAVGKAVIAAKLKVPPASGPFAYINPGIICGLIIFEKLAQIGEAQQIAASIAKQASELAGVTMPPVVQEGAIGAQAAGTTGLLPPNHVICGFKPMPQFGIRFL